MHYSLKATLALVILAAGYGTAQAADPADARDGEVVAIDVLLHPDEAMLKAAAAANARLRANYSAGFALDATHRPHITTIQRYVRRADLPKVYAAIDGVLAAVDPTKFELEAFGYYYLPVGELGLAGITVRPSVEIVDFQKRIIAAVEPLAIKGTGAAFVPPASGVIAPSIVDYVNEYVPKYSGKNFNPHVTVGLGHTDFTKRLVAAKFEPFTFRVTGLSVYHLGNFGTAQKELWSAGKKESVERKAGE